jgi:hypothetical protein
MAFFFDKGVHRQHFSGRKTPGLEMADWSGLS